ncbi:MAG: hypothetical protein QNK37_15125 [Acidobacteriota bacterium]|nr:hypothetical protein [Acidobacteriota bacterium]
MSNILFIPSFYQTVAGEMNRLYSYLATQDMNRPTALVVTSIAAQQTKDYLIASANLQTLRTFLDLPPSRLMLLPSSEDDANHFGHLFESSKFTPYIHPQIITVGDLRLIGLDPHDDVDSAVGRAMADNPADTAGIVRHAPLNEAQCKRHRRQVSFQLQGTRYTRAKKHGMLVLGGANQQMLYLRITPGMLTCIHCHFRDSGRKDSLRTAI